MEKNNIIPAICCIGYNRPDSMRRLLNSVVSAVYDDDNIPLIISIDESDMSDEVEAVARSFSWEHGEMIIKRYPQRMGLKEHCLRCGDLSQEYGALIFLEDDVIVAPGYYRYTKAAVNYYKDNSKVLGVSLYTQKWVQDMNNDFIPAHLGYDTFFLQRDISHGQCWLASGWKSFREWYEANKEHLPEYDARVPRCVYGWKTKTSWSKYMSFFLVEKDVYYACPYQAFATNMSEVGIHAKRTTDICQVPLSVGRSDVFRFGDFSNTAVYDAIFERKDRYVYDIKDIPFSDICMDLYGMKYDWSGYRYLLSSQTLNYEVVHSYGINMEPLENNVIYDVPGDSIRLYKVPDEYKGFENAYQIGKLGSRSVLLNHTIAKYPASSLVKSLIDRVLRKIFKI